MTKTIEKQGLRKKTITTLDSATFQKCLRIAKLEAAAWRDNDDALLGTAIARVACEHFGIACPAGVRIYVDQFTVCTPQPKANAEYGTKLRALYMTPTSRRRALYLVSKGDKGAACGDAEMALHYYDRAAAAFKLLGDKAGERGAKAGARGAIVNGGAVRVKAVR